MAAVGAFHVVWLSRKGADFMLRVPARRCVESAFACREGFPVLASHLDLALEWQHTLTLRAHVDDLDGVVDSWCFHGFRRVELSVAPYP